MNLSIRQFAWAAWLLAACGVLACSRAASPPAAADVAVAPCPANSADVDAAVGADADVDATSSADVTGSGDVLADADATPQVDADAASGFDDAPEPMDVPDGYIQIPADIFPPGPAIVPCDRPRPCYIMGACWIDWTKASFMDCRPVSDADCAQSEWCLKKGYCDKGKDGCTTLASQACPTGKACAIRGACAVAGDTCAPASPAHCAASANCKNLGKCTYLPTPGKQTGSCVVAADFDCSKLEVCASEGVCGFTPSFGEETGYCAPTQDSHCAGSKRCTEKGECTLVEGYCRPSTIDHCKKSSECAFSAACDLVEGWGELRCQVPLANDCTQTPACKQEGRCTRFGGKCMVIEDLDCADATACKSEGRCFFDARTSRCEKEKPIWPPNW